MTSDDEFWNSNKMVVIEVDAYIYYRKKTVMEKEIMGKILNILHKHSETSHGVRKFGIPSDEWPTVKELLENIGFSKYTILPNGSRIDDGYQSLLDMVKANHSLINMGVIGNLPALMYNSLLKIAGKEKWTDEPITHDYSLLDEVSVIEHVEKIVGQVLDSVKDAGDKTVLMYLSACKEKEVGDNEDDASGEETAEEHPQDETPKPSHETTPYYILEDVENVMVNGKLTNLEKESIVTLLPSVGLKLVENGQAKILKRRTPRQENNEKERLE